MKILMKKPDWIENTPWFRIPPTISYYTGVEVKYRFYNQQLCGSLRVNHIPDELEKIKWEPEDNKTYKCWWYWTNPSDPSDSGEDILVYIEELEDGKKESEEEKLKREYKTKINDYLNTLSLDSLKNLWERVKTY